MAFGSRIREFFGQREGARPTKQQGVSGFVVLGGHLQQNERNPKLIGQERWRTAARILTNISIVAAGVRYMLNLIARPAWRFEPANDSAEAKEMAEFAESVLKDIRGSWTGTVRRMALYRFHGFGIHEWVAKKRDDGKIGIEAIHVRPCHTVERWDVDASGDVLGVEQRRPQDGVAVYLPRGKVIYLVDDSLTDSPEGMGWFRHLVEPAERLKTLLGIEVMGFERDLSGIPIGRAPISEINELVGQQVGSEIYTATNATAALEGIKNFVTAEVRKPNTGLLMDSVTYVAQSDTGENISPQYKWDVQLLTGEQSSIDAMAKAVERLEFSMALIMGTESMLVGRGGEGSRALSEDKSKNLYLQATSTLEDMCEFVKRDILGPVWALNGLKDELMPTPTTESVAFKDAELIAKVLAEMSTAGAVLAPDDPAIDDIRALLDLPPMPKLSEEERALVMGTALPTPPVDPNKPQDPAKPGDKPKPGDKKPPKGGAPPNPNGGRGRAAQKYDPAQPRHPAGSPDGGQWMGVAASRTPEEADEFVDALPDAPMDRAWFDQKYGPEIDRKDLGLEPGKIITGIDYDSKTAREVLIDPMKVGTAQSSATKEKVKQYARLTADDPNHRIAVVAYVHLDGSTSVNLAAGTHRMMAAVARGVDRMPATMEIQVQQGWGKRSRRYAPTPANLEKFGFPADLAAIRTDKAFNPSQPRAPGGTSQGGQWVKAGLETYAGEDPYTNAIGINGKLRAGEDLSEADAATLAAVDQAFDQLEPMTGHAIVYRGSGEPAHGDSAIPHPISTSRDFDVAVEFSEATGGPNPTVYEISVLPGAKMLDMGAYLPESMAYQKEVLLERGGKLVYRSDRKDLHTHVRDGITVHRMVYVPPERVAKAFDPNQPRAPAGGPDGGKWIKSGIAGTDLRIGDVASALMDYHSATLDPEIDIDSNQFLKHTTVDPKELVSVQPQVQEPIVDRYRKKLRDGQRLDEIQVYVINGEKHIGDGNHRATAALKEGVKVPALVFDLDAAAKARGAPTVRPKPTAEED